VLAHARALLPWAPLPGGVVALVGPAGVLHVGAFGAADLERGLPMTTEHVVQIGSISKVFTALTVVELAARGVLSLDEPITDLLPWLVLGRGDDRPSVRELLSHMGGLVMGADFPPDDLAQAWRLRDSIVAPEPRRFHYSNVGFMLVGLGAAARAGRPWPELVREVLLEPLGMARSVASITEAARAALAVGYAPAREDRPWVPGDALAPAAWPETRSADGNVAAPAADLAQLVRLLLAGDAPAEDGLLDGRRVVAPGVLDQVATPTAVGGEPTPPYGPLPQATESTYGLGINIERVDGHELLTHGGGMVGFSTFMLVDRTAGFGVVVLTNANGDNLHAQLLARAAHADLVARLEGRSEVELPAVDTRVRVGELAPEALAALDARPGAAADPVIVGLGGATGLLHRTLTGRLVTDHPALRGFHLDLLADASGWTHGAVTLRPAAGLAGHAADGDPSWAPLVGHYRSYSPWFPHLRILVRDGRLLLVAPGGVEAPSEEEELVEVDPPAAGPAGPGPESSRVEGARWFRVGADPWLPSRLVVGPVVDGRAVSVELDGCLYSRTFTP
jgi:CubicO group peptidase (beta-lactamase class C family)